MNENEMGRAFSTCGGGEAEWENLRGKRPLGIRSHIWEKSTEMNLKRFGACTRYVWSRIGTSDGLL